MKTPLAPVLVCLTLALAACAPASKSGGSSTTFRGSVVQKVDAGWAADQVKITCAGAYCRPQVGILAYLEPRDGGFYLHRCTATLVGKDQVLSSYHCVTVGDVGFFILPNAVRKIAGVTFRAYGGLKKNGDPVTAPDAVILKLDQAITDVRPLEVVKDGAPAPGVLEAIVANQGAKQTEYHLDRATCRVGRHATHFPFDLAENPDLIYGYGCRLIEGNSGSPMFTPGDDRVQAVAQMIVKTDVDGLAIASNPRCYDPKSTCVHVTDAEITRRRRVAAENDGDGVRALGEATRQTFPTEMNIGRLALAQSIEGREAFEVYDLPKCLRRDAADPKEIDFLNQLVTVDATGAPVELRRRVIPGKVVARSGNTFRIDVTWPEPFAPLTRPDLHPSRRADLASPFKIEIPGCAR